MILGHIGKIIDIRLKKIDLEKFAEQVNNSHT